MVKNGSSSMWSVLRTLGLTRILGLISGAPAMGALFATAFQGTTVLALAPGERSGLQATFTVCAIAAISVALVVSGTPPGPEAAPI